MKRSIHKFSSKLLILLACIVSGCAHIPVENANTAYLVNKTNETPFPDSSQMKDALYRMYEEWGNVRYLNGGLSKDGIDCSGFVYITYLRTCGVMIPRNTVGQSKIGKTVSLRDLRTGDIVFFKTGIFAHHVGIFVEDGVFLHSSKTNGITLSKLENPYWSKRYWQSRRIIN